MGIINVENDEIVEVDIYDEKRCGIIAHIVVLLLDDDEHELINDDVIVVHRFDDDEVDEISYLIFQHIVCVVM